MNKKLFYVVTPSGNYTESDFVSEEKVLLMLLLNRIGDSLRNDDGVMKMDYSGMCAYVNEISQNYRQYTLLKDIIFENKPSQLYKENESYFFEPYLYEPRFEFLKELIKKY